MNDIIFISVATIVKTAKKAIMFLEIVHICH